MYGTAGASDTLEPPPYLLERLRQIPGYTWDESRRPFHSSYDIWHIYGTKDNGKRRQSSVPSSVGKRKNEKDHETMATAGLGIVARISVHALRDERIYSICKALVSKVDPTGRHIALPVATMKLEPRPEDSGPIVVCIFEDPGSNYMPQVVDYGPAWYQLEIRGDNLYRIQNNKFVPQSMTLQTFLDFAVGAAECLEMLHGQQIVHGEIRGDAFHMNKDTGRVKLINLGAGLRTFEHSLTSIGWSTMLEELGAKSKLSFMSPEQTGRMSIEPDSRTDIFSLGVLFWTVLTSKPAFEGETPMDILQAVLGQRLQLVSSTRLDIPEVIGRIIHKATAKTIFERYHSASGLRHDLVEIRRLLSIGDSAQLQNWEIATKDVSPYFILPKLVVGRATEHDAIVKVIDNAFNQHRSRQRLEKSSTKHLSRLSEMRSASFDTEDQSFDDDNASSSEGYKLLQTLPEEATGDYTVYKANSSKPRSRTNSLRNSVYGSGTDFQESDPRLPEKWLSTAPESGVADGRHNAYSGPRSSTGSAESIITLRNFGNIQSKGQCEVITIAGIAGLGKTRLIQSLQVDARQRGYFASSKFHPTEETPLAPVLKLLSSLFQQFFSESEMDLGFHEALKRHVAPVWHILHKVLSLPESLISSKVPIRLKSQPQRLSGSNNSAANLEAGRLDSPLASTRGNLNSKTMGAQSSQDFLRVGSSTKSLPSINIFLDILRLFASHKCICICLDDLHFADEESLDLIAQIVATEIKIVVILSYRAERSSDDALKGVLDTLTNEGNNKSSKVRVTPITLKPLTEDHILEYVAVALRRPKADISTLALFIQSVTAGNPFYIKEMLAACYRKKCIWFDYGEEGWVFDLDRVSKYFKRKTRNDTIGNDLVSNRLEELPPAARSILACASMLGPSFSFQLILRLLSGEFTAREPGHEPGHETGDSPTSHSESDCLTGLQAAIQAGIILPSDDDDIFRFAHDRYVGASASLGTYDVKLMHFIMAQTLVKYYSTDDKYHTITASSICESVEMIRSSVTHRRPFRKCLLDLARTACESGVRSEALKLYAACIALLQDDMWDDASYEETLQLYTEAVETCIYRGQYESAENLLLSVSSNARTAIDLAPSLILQSRLLAQKGDSTGAFEALKRCLVTLDVEVDHESTFSACDAEFKRLFQEIQKVDVDSLVNKAMIEDSNLAAVGAVLVEATSAAFWSDTLTFYRMTLIMVDTHLSSGTFPQSGMGFLQLALIAATRHNMISFASDCGNIALALIDKWKDPFTMGRGGTVYSAFVGHFQHPLQQSIPQLENALDFAIQAGDRIATILNFGFVSNLKFFTSANLVELESFCTYGCQDIPNWEMDTLGGTMIIAIKQVCRALQGKTDTGNPLAVMGDEQHDSLRYKSWLLHTVKNSDRPLMLYESIEIAPLFLYGHYTSAVDLGNSCLKKINAIWSARNTRFLMFFQALSLAGSVWVRVQEQLDPVYRAQSPLLSSDIHGTSLEATLQEEIEGMANLLRYFKRRIEVWQAVTDVNYLAWSKILAAQIAEMENDANGALRLWEEALAHASKHGFVFEEALASNLLGSYLLRKGSPRLAKTAFREAIVLYRQMGAIGVASHIEDEHRPLLRESSIKPLTADSGIQADLDHNPRDFHVVANDESPLNPVVSDKVHRWQEDTAFVDPLPIAALHMMDLTSLLKSSQVISSVLRVDQLLKTMCEIILQNCKGVASLAAIVIEELEGWVIAASGDPEEGAEAHNPSPPLKRSALIVESVVNYCGRFRETVFLPDLMLDDRFSNVNESWTARNPGSKSVVAFPICYGDENKPLLGVLYLEGQPNAFTARSLEVLQLLVNQIGISYFNALTLKEVERVSAINRSMVEVQKKALSEAIVAESKANIAKAEALRNAKLAEEAAQAKTTFLANISHELRTPLNGVIGNSDLLIDSQLEEHQAEMAGSIRVSADLLLILINDILDFSKIEAHKMELHLIPFDANKMVQEVIRSIPTDKRQRINSKNVQLVQNIKLPPILLKGDSLRLHQILGNLINNSMKFTEKGTVTIGAKTEWETEVAVHLTFWVEDTGIGIPTQQLHKLFKPFSQADASTARKYGGSGLGLSICKSLVESMHGAIKLESTEDVGTTVSFSLTLPKADSKALVGESQPDGGIPSSSNEDFAMAAFTNLCSLRSDQVRVCIAEDNLINQKIALQFLKKLKFDDVDAYDNGLVAVEGIRQKARDGRPYHIVLMDVQMPLLDGYEATKLLRKDPLAAVRGILVIAVTASAVQGDKEKCLASGMNDYLAKPVRLAVLKKKIGQYVQVP